VCWIVIESKDGVSVCDAVSVNVPVLEIDAVRDADTDGVCVKLEVRDCDLVPDSLELPDTEALTVAEGDCDPDTLADCVSVGVTVRVPDILPTWLRRLGHARSERRRRRATDRLRRCQR